jgi:hypothetical protein
MTTFTAENATYTTTNVQVKGNTFAILVVTGAFNYVSVRKVTNNPFGTLGKEFKNFAEATSHYKSPEMQIALLKVELGIL